MGWAAGGVAMSLFVVAVVLPIGQARSLDTPLPPTSVQAEETLEGVLVSWAPPIADGGSPVTSYTIEGFDGLTWTILGTEDGATTHFLDTLASANVLYRVVASNENGPSIPSGPAPVLSCEPLVIGGDLEFPFVHYVINRDCLERIVILRVTV